MKNLNIKFKALIGLSLLTVGLGGCTPTPEKTSAEDAQSLVDAMTYVKAKNGLCFGVATVSRISSGGNSAINQMIVPANCDKVGL